MQTVKQRMFRLYPNATQGSRPSKPQRADLDLVRAALLSLGHGPADIAAAERTSTAKAMLTLGDGKADRFIVASAMLQLGHGAADRAPAAMPLAPPTSRSTASTKRNNKQALKRVWLDGIIEVPAKLLLGYELSDDPVRISRAKAKQRRLVPVLTNTAVVVKDLRLISAADVEWITTRTQRKRVPVNVVRKTTIMFDPNKHHPSVIESISKQTLYRRKRRSVDT